MNKILYWDFSLQNERESAIQMRDKSAINYFINLISNDYEFKKLAYDFRYDCLKLIKKIIGYEIKGTVLEIGAGTGIYSCHISKLDEVDRVYALEYSKACVENLMIFIIKKFNLTEHEENKIIPIVGSFNDIKLPDNSIDFVISMGSIHHSENREITLKEIYRVLKIDGYLIACDKANFNYFTNKMLNKQLDTEYSNEIKKKMGYDVNQTYTRRMNSEHTPLLAEWEYLLAKCGFNSQIYWFQYFNGIIGVLWHRLGKKFFQIFGNKMLKKNLHHYYHIKIPYFPWFTGKKIETDNLLIISKKEPYYRMP